MIAPLDEATVKLKLAEYGFAQDMLKHYDTLNWQIGSILVGADAVLLGFVADGSFPTRFVHHRVLGIAFATLVSLFSAVLLLSWAFWFQRHRYLYNFRNETLHRLEEQLGMYHYLPLVAEGRTGKEAERLAVAKAAAGYSDDGETSFAPFYKVHLGGFSGYHIAWFLAITLPLVEFAVIVVRIFALD